ncbi:sigma-70 family RNA polymerase sigma factor [Paenibacillus tengchongensis]|uniref:sigma-70 family RNA polymerase sigma factor n=1 Tax=Paenibacillus tengchongensis TaxID=2608684 RepID=UPI001FE2E2E3|nr:sigma-70 family RNA polymerase sigma factor [Paenibacillus tengchongensis]
MTSRNYQLLRRKGIQDLHNMELLEACNSDKDLLGDFLMANRDFIFSILMHYKGNIEELRTKFRVTEEELFQHACIGVITALRDFDFHRGIKFTTYVVRPILWEINLLLYNDSQAVRLSRGAVDLIKKMVEIEEILGHRPDEKEMAELLQVSVDRYREIAMFSNDLEHYDGMENFDIADSRTCDFEDSVANRLYVQSLLEDSRFSDFEKQVMRLIMEEVNNAQIAERLQVYPMTISRTINRIRNKINEQDMEDAPQADAASSKYDREISLVAEETRERQTLLGIHDVSELLEVCGCQASTYSTRVLYYIRQKAVQQVSGL